jgi:protein TonB
LNTENQNSAGWLTRAVALVVSLLVHTALFLWLLSANIAGNEAALPPTPFIPIELVKIPPPPPPPPEIKTAVKPDKKPQPKRAATRAAAPKMEQPGPPVHEISTRDDEWVAPRVNDNKSFVIGARRAPSDYADKVKSQVVSRIDYPEDALYKVPRNYKGDLKDLRQQCRVAYEISVDRNGKMLSYKFDPCGSTKLDAAVEAGLKNSGPFPPPPDQGAESYVIYGVKIFRLPK